MNVNNRDLIPFHPSNDALKELNGCIAPVMEFTGEGKGLRSKVAFERLKEIIFPYLEKEHTIESTIKKDVQ